MPKELGSPSSIHVPTGPYVCSSASGGSEGLHPIACSFCRKIHKKCDRRKPSCSRCKLKGIPCEYKEPVKKVTRNTENIEYINNNIDTISDSGSLIPNSKGFEIKQNTVEAYCTMVCFGVPPFEKSHLEKLINLNYYDMLQNKKEILCFLLTMQGLCEQRFGFADLAEQTMKRAREILGHVFDDWDNPYILCCYAHFSIYYTGEGQMKKARYYISFLEQFIREVAIEPNAKDAFIPEFNLFYFQIGILEAQLTASPTFPIPDFSVIRECFSILIGVEVPDEWKEALSSKTYLENNNVEERLRLFDFVVDVLFKKFRELDDTDYVAKCYDFYVATLKNGFYLLVLSLAGYGDITKRKSDHNEVLDEKHQIYMNIMEQCALNINYLTESELFMNFSPYLIPFVLIASKFNLEVAKSIDAGERENLQPSKVPSISTYPNTQEPIDYFVIVGKDLRALQFLSKRFRFVARYTTEIDEFLQKRFNDFTFQFLNPTQQFSKLNDFEKRRQMEENKWSRVSNFYEEMKHFICRFNNRLIDHPTEPKLSPLSAVLNTNDLVQNSQTLSPSSAYKNSTKTLNQEKNNYAVSKSVERSEESIEQSAHEDFDPLFAHNDDFDFFL
ncbi:hypothetical protein ABK040_010674 [Willaertia magna]